MNKSKKFSIFTMIAASFAMIIGFLVPQSAMALGTPQQEFNKHSEYIAGIVDAHNEYRLTRGLKPFVFSPDISLRVSQPFTHTMARNDKLEIWHNTSAKMLEGGSYAGENVAGGIARKGTPTETPKELVQRWIDSPGHHANIIDPRFSTLAIGFAVSDSGRWTYATVNLYGTPKNPGKTYANGGDWLRGVAPTDAKKPTDKNFNVYLTEGTHDYNGRLWRTTCEPYSQTERCRTEIWASPVIWDGSKYVVTQGWAFNNLTYAPSPRNLWTKNPLGGNGVVGGKASWTSDGRKWRTECDTPATGRGACRSYTMGTVIEKHGNGYRTVTKEIFNNIVMFSN